MARLDDLSVGESTFLMIMSDISYTTMNTNRLNSTGFILHTCIISWRAVTFPTAPPNFLLPSKLPCILIYFYILITSIGMGKTGNKKKQTGSAEVSGEDDHESYVSLATVKAMLAIQESTIISMFDSTIKTLNSQIDILNSEVTNLKVSLEFSQKGVADLKQLAPKVNGLQCEMDTMKVTSNQQENKLEYIENQSRRNNIRIMLYYALIFSFLSYGIETWGLTYSSYLKLISIIKKKCTSIMTFSEPQSHSEPLLRSLNLLKFTDLITFQILNFIHKWAHNL